jgi:hypothetical protein
MYSFDLSSEDREKRSSILSARIPRECPSPTLPSPCSPCSMECEDYHLQLGVACSASGPRLRFKRQSCSRRCVVRERLKLDKRTKLEAIAAAVDLARDASLLPAKRFARTESYRHAPGSHTRAKGLRGRILAACLLVLCAPGAQEASTPPMTTTGLPKHLLVQERWISEHAPNLCEVKVGPFDFNADAEHATRAECISVVGELVSRISPLGCHHVVRADEWGFLCPKVTLDVHTGAWCHPCSLARACDDPKSHLSSTATSRLRYVGWKIYVHRPTGSTLSAVLPRGNNCTPLAQH